MQNDAKNVEIQLHVMVTLISMHFYFKKRDKPANQYANKSGPQIHKLFCYFWKHSIHNSFDSNPLSYQRVSKRVLWENICWACKYFCEQIKAKKLLSAVRIFHMLAASISINLLKNPLQKGDHRTTCENKLFALKLFLVAWRNCITCTIVSDILQVMAGLALA